VSYAAHPHPAFANRIFSSLNFIIMAIVCTKSRWQSLAALLTGVALRQRNESETAPLIGSVDIFFPQPDDQP
jgi:hypothetical protein